MSVHLHHTRPPQLRMATKAGEAAPKAEDRIAEGGEVVTFAAGVFFAADVRSSYRRALGGEFGSETSLALAGKPASSG